MGWISRIRLNGTASSRDKTLLLARRNRGAASAVTRGLLIQRVGGFEPHDVDDAEATGQQDAEDPGKIPHSVRSSVKAVGVGVNVLGGHFAPHFGVAPKGVAEDQRHENRCGNQHNVECHTAGNRIPYGQAGGRVDTRRHDKGEQGKTSGAEGANDGQAAAQERAATVTAAGRKQGQQRPDYSHYRCDDGQRVFPIVRHPAQVARGDGLAQRIQGHAGLKGGGDGLPFDAAQQEPETGTDEGQQINRREQLSSAA